jgi:hypothetical protein
MAKDTTRHTTERVAKGVQKLIDDEVRAVEEQIRREANHDRAAHLRATGALYFPDPNVQARQPATDSPTAATTPPRSRTQQILKTAADESFPAGWEQLPTKVIIKQASGRPEVKALNREPGYDTWTRALGRRRD